MILDHILIPLVKEQFGFDKNGNLESGDYITSCTIPGYGMKQNDDILHNYTVAKITMDCNFNPVTQSVRQILKDSDGNNILDSMDLFNGKITKQKQKRHIK